MIPCIILTIFLFEKILNIDFEELNEALEWDSILLIDVRNRSELISKGKIPKSFNVPLHEIVSGVFQLDKQNFTNKYDFEKPEKNDEFVVSCHSGYRALKAGKYLKSLGYRSVRVYNGSFEDWILNSGTIIRGSMLCY